MYRKIQGTLAELYQVGTSNEFGALEYCGDSEGWRKVFKKNDLAAATSPVEMRSTAEQIHAIV